MCNKDKVIVIKGDWSRKMVDGWRLHVDKLSSYYYDLLSYKKTIVHKPTFSNRKVIVFFNLYLRINEVGKLSCEVKYSHSEMVFTINLFFN